MGWGWHEGVKQAEGEHGSTCCDSRQEEECGVAKETRRRTLELRE